MALRPGVIDAILFDAGNTLLHLDYEYICEILGRHGHATEPLAFRLAEYGARAAIDRELAPDMAPPESVEGLLWGDGERPSYFAVALHHLGISGAAAAPILAELKRSNEESCLWRIVEPDTAAVLEALRERGLRLAVVSNADGRVEDLLRTAGLAGFFEIIIDSSKVGVEKPDPRIFGFALDHVGVAAERAVYVGDVYGIDVAGARRAGLTPVLIDRLHRYPRQLDCLRIAELPELPALIPEQAKG